ncbi:16628_t:CDS:2 [Cetraspora pellucida]|uniref:16628_t:CDS:1 n=1 Tax=Cetraspora pellucida TaxID=1433469 RepID=A0A9N9C2D3_9GLOM|nr:16628_t:CDS:2 [Cetraspora pellucida]
MLYSKRNLRYSLNSYSFNVIVNAAPIQNPFVLVTDADRPEAGVGENLINTGRQALRNFRKALEASLNKFKNTKPKNDHVEIAIEKAIEKAIENLRDHFCEYENFPEALPNNESKGPNEVDSNEVKSKGPNEAVSKVETKGPDEVETKGPNEVETKGPNEVETKGPNEVESKGKKRKKSPNTRHANKKRKTKTVAIKIGTSSMSDDVTSKKLITNATENMRSDLPEIPKIHDSLFANMTTGFHSDNEAWEILEYLEDRVLTSSFKSNCMSHPTVNKFHADTFEAYFGAYYHAVEELHTCRYLDSLMTPLLDLILEDIKFGKTDIGIHTK